MDAAKYLNGTTSQSVVSGGGKIYGIIINSHTLGTIKIWDALTATGTVIMNTFTVPTGSQMYMFPTPIDFYTGLFITVGGTVDYTILTRIN
jgi:hypothetical protein